MELCKQASKQAKKSKNTGRTGKTKNKIVSPFASVPDPQMHKRQNQAVKQGPRTTLSPVRPEKESWRMNP
jgi:hypothetical protein